MGWSPDICQQVLMQKGKLGEGRSLKHAFPAPVAHPLVSTGPAHPLTLSGPAVLQGSCAPVCLGDEQMQRR